MRNYFLFLLCATTSLHAQDAKEILQKYFETVSNGDIKNWDTIKSVYIESEGFYSQQSFDGQPDFSGTKVTYSKTYRVWPHWLKTEIYEDSTYARLLSSSLSLGNKNKTIQWFKNVPAIVTPIKDVQWHFYPVILYRIVKKASVKYKGIRSFESGSISCFDVEVKSKDTHLNLYINSNTYLLEYLKMFNASDSSNYTKFYNHKNVGGFVFEMSTHSMRKGTIFFSYQIKKIHLNYPIDPDIFREPSID
jgi:hypothetical protein